METGTELYNFENNGDIYQIDSEGESIYIGRCDSEGDITLDADYASSHSDVFDSLWDVLIRSLPGFQLSGDLDWTPAVCYLRACGIEGRYDWDAVNDQWIEKIKP